MKARVIYGGLTFVVGFLAGCGAFAICTFLPWYFTVRTIMDRFSQ